MKKIIECVPNFSEGRDQKTIDAIADAIKKTDGCTLFDVDSGLCSGRWFRIRCHRCGGNRSRRNGCKTDLRSEKI